MKKYFIVLFISLFSFLGHAQDDISKQLFRNATIGWDVYKNSDYRWRNSFIGTGYAQNISVIPNAHWYVGGRINWNKYTLYPNGDFSMGASKATLKTTSISIPVQFGYQIFKQKGFGLDVFTGPNIEFLLSSKLDGYAYDKVNYFHSGWSVGSSFQFLHIFRARVAYSYYPTSLLTDKYMPRESVSFSLGF